MGEARRKKNLDDQMENENDQGIDIETDPDTDTRDDSGEEKKESFKEKFENKEKANKDLEEAAKDAEEEAIKLGFDVGFEPDFDKHIPKKGSNPKARLVRPSTMGDRVRAELFARRHFGVQEGEDTPDYALMLGRISLLVRFDGEFKPLPVVEKYDPVFLLNLSVVYMKHLLAAG